MMRLIVPSYLGLVWFLFAVGHDQKTVLDRGEHGKNVMSAMLHRYENTVHPSWVCVCEAVKQQTHQCHGLMCTTMSIMVIPRNPNCYWVTQQHGCTQARVVTATEYLHTAYSSTVLSAGRPRLFSWSNHHIIWIWALYVSCCQLCVYMCVCVFCRNTLCFMKRPLSSSWLLCKRNWSAGGLSGDVRVCAESVSAWWSTWLRSLVRGSAWAPIGQWWRRFSPRSETLCLTCWPPPGTTTPHISFDSLSTATATSTLCRYRKHSRGKKAYNATVLSSQILLWAVVIVSDWSWALADLIFLLCQKQRRHPFKITCHPKTSKVSWSTAANAAIIDQTAVNILV